MPLPVGTLVLVWLGKSIRGRAVGIRGPVPPLVDVEILQLDHVDVHVVVLIIHGSPVDDVPDRVASLDSITDRPAVGLHGALGDVVVLPDQVVVAHDGHVVLNVSIGPVAADVADVAAHAGPDRGAGIRPDVETVMPIGGDREVLPVFHEVGDGAGAIGDRPLVRAGRDGQPACRC